MVLLIDDNLGELKNGQCLCIFIPEICQDQNIYEEWKGLPFLRAFGLLV